MNLITPLVICDRTVGWAAVLDFNHMPSEHIVANISGVLDLEDNL